MIDSERKANRDSVKNKVFKILQEFETLNEITESILIENIIILVKSCRTDAFKFNIGHSLKLINILLKYY